MREVKSRGAAELLSCVDLWVRNFEKKAARLDVSRGGVQVLTQKIYTTYVLVRPASFLFMAKSTCKE